jgi:hypothetical protein
MRSGRGDLHRLLDRGFEFLCSVGLSIPSRLDQAGVDIRFREVLKARRTPRSPIGDVSDVEPSAEDSGGEEAVRLFHTLKDWTSGRNSCRTGTRLRANEAWNRKSS